MSLISKKIRKTTIQGKSVQIYLLPALEGILMARELAEIVIPTVGSFYQGFAEENLNFENLAMVLMSELDKIDVAQIITRLLKDMAVNESSVDFDDYFMANYGELVEILIFAIKENFSSFFAAKGLFDKYLPKRVEDQTTQAE